MDYKGRLSRARQTLQRSSLDALLVTHLPNIAYLCGFTGSSGVLVLGPAPSGSVFFTDGRYTQQTRQEVNDVKIKIQPGKSASAAASAWLSRQNSWRRVGIDAAHLTIAERDAFAKS